MIVTVVRCVDFDTFSSMPPFGAEGAEPLREKTLSFLSLSHGPKPKPRRPHSVFGAEPAENASCSDVGSECGPQKRHTSLAQKFSGLFGSEPEEGCGQPYAKVQRTKPGSSVFGEEPEEPDEADSSALNPDRVFLGDSDDEPLSDHDFLPTKKDVFSLGWHCVTNFQYATFWKDNKDDPTSKKTSRIYDNSRRSANAAYTRANQAGVQQKNGVDPTRLRNLFQSPQCQCAKSVFGDKTLCFSFVDHNFHVCRP